MSNRNVIKPFKLNTTDGVVEFAAGTQKIDDDLVKHWFVQAHLEPLGDDEEEDEAGEKKRLLAELAAMNITVGANIKLETLRQRVEKARADANDK